MLVDSTYCNCVCTILNKNMKIEFYNLRGIFLRLQHMLQMDILLLQKCPTLSFNCSLVARKPIVISLIIIRTILMNL